MQRDEPHVRAGSIMRASRVLRGEPDCVHFEKGVKRSLRHEKCSLSGLR